MLLFDAAWCCLHLLARFRKRIPEGHRFHVFLQAFGNLPCSYLHFSFGAEGSIDNLSMTVLGIVRCDQYIYIDRYIRNYQNAQWWYIITIITYQAKTCIQLFCTQLPVWNYSVKNSTKDRVSNQFSCFSTTCVFLQNNVWLNCGPNQTHWKHFQNTSTTHWKHIDQTH